MRPLAQRQPAQGARQSFATALSSRHWARALRVSESENILKLLKKRLQEIGRGRFVGPSEERVLLTDLLDALTVDYELNGRRSLKTSKSSSLQKLSFWRSLARRFLGRIQT